MASESVVIEDSLDAALVRLSQDDAINIQDYLALAPQAVKDEQQAFVGWTFLFKLVSQPEKSDKVIDLLETSAEASHTFHGLLLSYHARLIHTSPDTLIHEDISLGWSVVFMLTVIDKPKSPAANTDLFKESITTWLINHCQQFNWNTAPAKGQGQGKTALWWLSCFEQWAIINALVAKNIYLDWNAVAAEGPSQGKTALWWLCCSGQWELVKLLVSKNSTPNSSTKEPSKTKSLFERLVHHKPRINQDTVVSNNIVLDWNKVPAEGLSKGKSALWLLCCDEQWDIVKTLLANNAALDWNIAPAKGPSGGKSALWLLCHYEQWEIIKLLLAKDIILNWDSRPTEGPNQGKSALWNLCFDRQWDIINILLNKAFALDWNAKAAEGPNQGKSVLWYLCFDRQWDIINILLSKALVLDWNTTAGEGPNQGKSALWCLCYHQQWDIIKLLLANNVVLDWNHTLAKKPSDGMSAFWLLCAYKQWELVNSLIANDIILDWNIAPTDGKNKGISALWLLCLDKQWNTVNMLLARSTELEWNACPEEGDNGGKTVLWLLCQHQQWEVISFVLATSQSVCLDRCLAKLLTSPYVMSYQAPIRRHLYRTTATELTLELSSMKPETQAFLQEILNYHPTLTAIDVGAQRLTSQYPEKLLRQRELFNVIKVEQQALRAKLEAQMPLDLDDLPSSFTEWLAKLEMIDSLAHTVWYSNELYSDYSLTRLEFLQICVVPQLLNTSLAQQLQAQLANVIEQMAKAKLAWDIKAHFYEVAFHCLLPLVENKTLGTTWQLKLISLAYYAYGQAKQTLQNTANNGQDLLITSWHQRRIGIFHNKQEELLSLCHHLLLEQAELGFRQIDESLSSEESLKLVHTFARSMGIEVGSAATSITSDKIVAYLLDNYQQRPELLGTLIQQQLQQAKQIKKATEQAEQLTTQQTQLTTQTMQLASYNAQLTGQVTELTEQNQRLIGQNIQLLDLARQQAEEIASLKSQLTTQQTANQDAGGYRGVGLFK